MLAICAIPGSPQPQLQDVPQPSAPRAGEVLCETLELGVCGTDREILHSLKPHVPPGEQRLILGHECLARVVALGDQEHGLRVGDLVVPLVRRAYDTTTRLARERADLLAFGTFVERGIYLSDGFSPKYWLDRPEHLLRVSLELAPVAVFAEPLSICEKGINEALVLQRARVEEAHWVDPPPRVLVTGLGPIAFAGVIATVARGWPVTVFGRDADDTFRADLVRRFGATYTHDAARLAPANVEHEGFDLLLECTGSDAVMVAASQSVRSLGVIVWLGSTRTPEPHALPIERMMRDGILRNHLHLGTVNSARRDFADALAHLAQLQATHSAELAALFTARVSIQDSLWHYEHREPQGIKTVVVSRQSAP
jgi:threonine dehydrogenase-like Zn-dependent dehydrogenase